jgi:FtsH-binding integral membrane protein
LASRGGSGRARAAKERSHDLMNYSIAVILYVVFAILVGLCGSQRRMGFIGTFIVSLLFTPVIVLIVLLLTGPSQRAIVHRRQPSE